MNPSPATPRHLLERLYAAAIRAADPAAASQQALSSDLVLGPNVRILAVGKASRGMAAGARAALRARGLDPSAMLVVAPPAADRSALAQQEVAGDHPIPGQRSAEAADAVARFVSGATPDDDVVALVSGGTTSLIASPVDDVTRPDLIALFRGLLASGVDIATMNAVRKRVLRWGAGRLASALYPARVHCLVASDVIGNDLGAIGSGPCVPDHTTASALIAAIDSRGLSGSIPRSIAGYLERVASGLSPETPKPNEKAFDRVATRVVLDASNAIAGAVECATELGLRPVVASAPIIGDAADAGVSIARGVLEESRTRSSETTARTAFIWWGETTVRLPPDAPPGGRCQELALACAGVLDHAGDEARNITVLAAGTDGRDGPTDAAGAVVDYTTWGRIAGAGRNPAQDLADHASYASLAAAGALFRANPTGTNVNDLVFALIEPG